MPTVALLKGPNLRHDGNVATWEALNERSEFDVVAFASDPPRFDYSDIDLPVRELPWLDGVHTLFGHEHFMFKGLRKAHLPRGYLRGVAGICEEFDIVHANENFNISSIQSALATRSRDTAFALHVDENIPYPRSQHNPFLWQLKKFTNRRADGITATTTPAKRALIHEGVPHEKITVLPHSVDLSIFGPDDDPDYDAVGLDSSFKETFNILFVHKLCEQKGTPYLLDAFERLQREYDHIRLILVGSNKLGEEFDQRVETNHAIRWLEFVPFEMMSDLYNCADVTVLPSVTMTTNEEQFGMAVLEAMACGVPSVVTDVGGIPSVVSEGETAATVEERDAEGLANGIEQLIRAPERREKMGENARQRAVDVFEPSVNADILATFYRNIV